MTIGPQVPRISTGVLLYGKTAGGNYMPVRVASDGSVKMQGSGTDTGNTGGGFNTSPLESYATQTVEVGTTSVMLLDTNADRRHAIVINLGQGRIFLGLGSAAQLNQGILLQPNGHYEMDWDNLYTGRIYAISDESATISVLEGV